MIAITKYTLRNTFMKVTIWTLKKELRAAAKGQLILKGLFCFFYYSPIKRTENFCPSARKKLTFSSLFFGRIEYTKISFLDKLTFKG